MLCAIEINQMQNSMVTPSQGTDFVMVRDYNLTHFLQCT